MQKNSVLSSRSLYQIINILQAFKNRTWDGKIRLFNGLTYTLYAGLLDYIYKFAEERCYKIEFTPPVCDISIDENDLKQFIDSFECYANGSKIKLHDHQVTAIGHALKTKRCILVSPTGSGKSLIIYGCIRYLLDKIPTDKKILIIVPTTGLVSQLLHDFHDYSNKDGFIRNCHVVYSGKEKSSTRRVVISTWQSIHTQKEEFFKDFYSAFGDECLHPHTNILMSDGYEKKIEDILVGECVKTINEKTKEIEDKLVLKVHKGISSHEQMYEIILSNGEIVRITGNHKVLLSTGEWKRTDSLKIGDAINTYEKVKIDKESKVTISSIRKIESSPEVYNLHIQDNHNYFAEGMSVSNCHLFKAKSLTTIMTKLKECPIRIGTTGTLDGTHIHKLVIEGLFGRVFNVTSTKELMEKDLLTNLKINCLVLQYNPQEIQEIKRAPYVEEIQWLIGNEKRNSFIVDLCCNLKGNTLVLFNFVEKHGLPLFDRIKKKSNKSCYLIYGKTQTEDRENIRQIVNKQKESILVASYGTCSTGINIKNIDNIVFTSPSKSVVRVLQSIGRGLRKSENKDKVVLYDIGDDLRYKSHRNHALRHMNDRIQIYTNERFVFKVTNIRLQETA